MPVLHKIRIFGWPLGQGVLPVGHRVKATSLGDGVCKLCGIEVETLLHAMRECRCTQEVFEHNRWVHSNQLIPTRLVLEYAQIVKVRGQIKVNVDGAWIAAKRDATIRVIASDHHGLVINGCARRIEGVHNAETVEACAFEEGVRMAIANGWENVVIEGDALGIVNRLKATKLDHSVAVTFLTETKETLRVHAGFQIQHVTWEANRTAHEVAHSIFQSPADCIFDLVVPEFISTIVINDAIFSD
ncbi:hypothetical protein V6N13_064460 [Hibiscus sabdariffa]